MTSHTIRRLLPRGWYLENGGMREFPEAKFNEYSKSEGMTRKFYIIILITFAYLFYVDY